LKPVVFTPGTMMRHPRQFFAEAVDACGRLGRRGLLLTRFRDQLPASLPGGVRHFDYVPLSQGEGPTCRAVEELASEGRVAPTWRQVTRAV
jgi:hypothetical protein